MVEAVRSLGTDSVLSVGRVAERAVASVFWRAGLIIPLALLLVLVAACGDDDDGTQPGPGTGSPTPSLQTTAGASPTTAPASSGGEQSPPPVGPNSGTATISGVQYDFTTDSCAITPDSVVILGSGRASDGRTFIATASWYRVDIFGDADVVDVGIHTNVTGLLDPPDQSFRMGSSVENSTIESIDVDVTGFDVVASGTFIDKQAPEAPPVTGTFSVSCN